MNLNQSILSKFEYEIKKSKFIALVYELKTKNDFENIYKFIKEEYAKANHICYAYLVENTGKYYDAGEPKGTAGKPIYQLLMKLDLNQIAVFVIRYFGGIKLGSGNLIRSYVKSANEAIKIFQNKNN